MTTLPQGLTVEQWAAELNRQWRRLIETTVSGFIGLGDDLAKARKELGTSGWRALAEILEFKPNTAGAFMRISEWVGIVGIAHNRLPPDYTTIDKLTRLDEQVCGQLIKDGKVCPELKRNEVSRILRSERMKADEARVLNLSPRPGKYRTIVLDPAWEYDNFSESAQNAKIGVYAKQSFDELWNMDFKQWAETDCHLYCWSTNAHVAKACDLVRRWGFEYKGILTWLKVGANGQPVFGLGLNWRNATEKVVYATIGKQGLRRNDIPDWFTAPRGEHSEKPEEFYDIVRAASYPPYGEGNQRKMRPDFADLFMEGEPLQKAV